MEFATFSSTGPVAAASIERFGPAVPAPVVELWRTVGTGLVGRDGFVRVVDPAWYADHLATWFDNAEGAVPFLATGMGDLFIWKEPAIRHVLVTRSLDPKGTGQGRWVTRWKPALNAFAVTFADRMLAAENL